MPTSLQIVLSHMGLRQFEDRALLRLSNSIPGYCQPFLK